MTLRYAWLLPLFAVTSVLLNGEKVHAEPLDDARAATEQARAERDALAIEQDPAAASGHRAELRRLAREAQALYRLAGAEDSNDVALLSEYAAALELTEDYDLAVAVLERATKADPNDPALWLELGEKTLLLGAPRLADARAALEAAVRLKPDDPALIGAAYTSLAEVYLRFGFYDLAIVYLERTLRIVPENVPNIITLATLYLREGQVKVASDVIEQLGSAVVPHAAMLQERLTLALGDFERGRLWFPDTAENHLAYAKLLFRVGRVPDSLMAIERSVELEDQDAAAWNVLGSISRQSGNLERAREAFERSLALDPDQPRTREALESIGETQ